VATKQAQLNASFDLEKHEAQVVAEDDAREADTCQFRGAGENRGQSGIGSHLTGYIKQPTTTKLRIGANLSF